MSWWWFSFCDPHRPRGSQFLGVAIIEAGAGTDRVSEAKAAHVKLSLMGINPGGEAQIHCLPDAPPEEYRDRLLTMPEVEAINAHWRASQTKH